MKKLIFYSCIYQSVTTYAAELQQRMPITDVLVQQGVEQCIYLLDDDQFNCVMHSLAQNKDRRITLGMRKYFSEFLSTYLETATYLEWAGNLASVFVVRKLRDHFFEHESAKVTVGQAFGALIDLYYFVIELGEFESSGLYEDENRHHTSAVAKFEQGLFNEVEGEVNSFLQKTKRRYENRKYHESHQTHLNDEWIEEELSLINSRISIMQQSENKIKRHLKKTLFQQNEAFEALQFKVHKFIALNGFDLHDDRDWVELGIDFLITELPDSFSIVFDSNLEFDENKGWVGLRDLEGHPVYEYLKRQDNYLQNIEVRTGIELSYLVDSFNADHFLRQFSAGREIIGTVINENLIRDLMSGRMRSRTSGNGYSQQYLEDLKMAMEFNQIEYIEVPNKLNSLTIVLFEAGLSSDIMGKVGWDSNSQFVNWGKLSEGRISDRRKGLKEQGLDLSWEEATSYAKFEQALLLFLDHIPVEERKLLKGSRIGIRADDMNRFIIEPIKPTYDLLKGDTRPLFPPEQ